ncbi:KilA-N domain-containing protein [Hominifimenecus sp. rT4P-3]|uniref:KilA-N domain-containing protein n=1 Tax=Hominifimenecus sp. rT4P-3 TaxID=3242979 RepID=UPI003DA28DE3
MKLNANGIEISVIMNQENTSDYISLTDIAKRKDPDEPRIVISNWMSSYSTIDFLATWETLYNPNFNRLEFQTVRSEPGRLIMTPKQWIERMSAIGITSQAGRYGGTYAHSDIAFEFASWISPEFKLYLIKDYQRLKTEESRRLELGWDTKRELSKINYRIHTDAIKEFLITPELTKQEQNYTYATEADILNVALFGKTAKQWREETGHKKLNIRDFASVEQLIVLVNLESMNADLIRQKLPANERVQKLRSIAYYQLHSLTSSNAADKLKQDIQNRIEQKKS